MRAGLQGPSLGSMGRLAAIFRSSGRFLAELPTGYAGSGTVGETAGLRGSPGYFGVETGSPEGDLALRRR